MTRPFDRPRVIAHRGASADFPENTLLAFDVALDQGAQGLELDVQLSRDGVPVVYHDRTLARAGGGRKRVARVDFAELRRLDAGAWLDRRFRGQHIPALEEVLARYGRRTHLLVELKVRDAATGPLLARAIVDLVVPMKLDNSLTLLSFDAATLRECAARAPAIPRALNLRPPRRPGAALTRDLAWLDAVSADVATLTPAFGAAVRGAGRELYAFTCNTPRRATRAVEAGAAALMTDRPAWLVDYLRRRSPTVAP